MSESLWGVALDWQAYLEEATAGLRNNAIARTVREELRAPLEEARQRVMAEEGLDAEEAAREAVRHMGAPQAVGAALRARHSVDWPRVVSAGAAAGVAGAAVFALGLHLLWRVVLAVMTIGDQRCYGASRSRHPLHSTWHTSTHWQRYLCHSSGRPVRSFLWLLR